MSFLTPTSQAASQRVPTDNVTDQGRTACLTGRRIAEIRGSRAEDAQRGSYFLIGFVAGPAPLDGGVGP